MSNQNYKNHSRLVPGYHYITGTILLAVIIGAVVNLWHATESNRYSASLILALSLVILSMFFYARGFALKAQDRAIRAEENFRYFILTGKPLDKSLRMSQIIALRFASDAELPALAQRATAENLSNKEIKKAVQNWRADYNRV